MDSVLIQNLIVVKIYGKYVHYYRIPQRTLNCRPYFTTLKDFIVLGHLGTGEGGESNGKGIRRESKEKDMNIVKCHYFKHECFVFIYTQTLLCNGENTELKVRRIGYQSVKLNIPSP